ncbi:hypothetical protein F5146DRAFT_125614 [Armillaria mellea]|nr:hypothetical protein F5146DRAFT_125614 [Armillaria mellea]
MCHIHIAPSVSCGQILPSSRIFASRSTVRNDEDGQNVDELSRTSLSAIEGMATSVCIRKSRRSKKKQATHPCNPYFHIRRPISDIAQLPSQGRTEGVNLAASVSSASTLLFRCAFSPFSSRFSLHLAFSNFSSSSFVISSSNASTLLPSPMISFFDASIPSENAFLISFLINSNSYFISCFIFSASPLPSGSSHNGEDVAVFWVVTND